MNAEVIRERFKFQMDGFNGASGFYAQALWALSANFVFTAEVAAQLAETNESLKKIANPLLEVVNAEAPGSKLLRDELAMAAMQAMLTSELKGYRPDRNKLAEDSYFYADAMLEERKK